MILLLSSTSEAIGGQSRAAMPLVEAAMSHLAVGIGVIGVAAITWGMVCGVIKWIGLEWTNFQRRDVGVLREQLRRHLGFYLLLGLEFLVAADIIETLMSPTLEHLAILGGIVVIRTVISYGLNWELSQSASHTGVSES